MLPYHPLSLYPRFDFSDYLSFGVLAPSSSHILFVHQCVLRLFLSKLFVIFVSLSATSLLNHVVPVFRFSDCFVYLSVLFSPLYLNVSVVIQMYRMASLFVYRCFLCITMSQSLFVCLFTVVHIAVPFHDISLFCLTVFG